MQRVGAQGEWRGTAGGEWGRWGKRWVWPRVGVIGEGGVLGPNSAF